MPVASLLVIVPAVGIFAVLAAGNTLRRARGLALAFSLASFVLALLLFATYLDPGLSDSLGLGLQRLDVRTGDPSLDRTFWAYEEYTWVPSLNFRVFFGVDGLSLPLILLTPLLTAAGIVFSWHKSHRPKEFFALLLLLQLAITGVFTTLHLFLFFVFWEGVLIPMWILIAVWGGDNRRYASYKFLIYTHIGAVIMLLGIFALWARAGTQTLSMVDMATDANLVNLFRDLTFASPVFLAFLVGFGIKLPMVPFHTWLPDAHVEAPTAGSVILAGLLLKMGGYGIFRIAFGLLPAAAAQLWWVVALFGATSMVYTALVCLRQVDLKRLIAYSSVGHMGFVLLGASSLTTIGIEGGIFQMFNHGLITAVLFMLAGAVKHATGTRDISKLTGLGSAMPLFSFVLMMSFFASMGLPGFNGFISEFMVFVGTYEGLPDPTRKLILIPLISVVLTGAYYLWTMHKVVFGTFNEQLGKVRDLHFEEALPMLILLALIVFFGLYPTPMIDVMKPPSDYLTALVGGV